jgi:hypothetical protein
VYSELSLGPLSVLQRQVRIAPPIASNLPVQIPELSHSAEGVGRLLIKVAGPKLVASTGPSTSRPGASLSSPVGLQGYKVSNTNKISQKVSIQNLIGCHMSGKVTKTQGRALYW